MKRKSITDSRSVEHISDKRLSIEIQPAQTNGVERVKRSFCERPFGLRRQQPENDKQNFDVAPPGKIYADAHGSYKRANGNISYGIRQKKGFSATTDLLVARLLPNIHAEVRCPSICKRFERMLRLVQ